ncbi:DUF2802 domain-containing protein [Zoogloea sp.]|uniref:DUF2802 domain-containing protein n=1 Tax=Zoogloea sp. TaxID=49181 RepID=UPI0025D7C5A1|nr:DUF2802 domain-containing protein [Zoogloea sp.]MCK6395096.1 DUF2802 domain-containing protein [Zoogloea sp.]
MIDIGVHEGVWALVAVLVLYLAVILFRLASPRKPADSGEKPGAPNTLLVDEPAAAAPEPQPVPPPSPEEEAVSRDLLNELEIQQLRRDVAQLRTESDFLRRELAATRRDVDELRDELKDAQQTAREPVQYARPVSPQHSEAMLLAGRGIDAARIAEHCGISVAEAELVCALARAEEGR